MAFIGTFLLIFGCVYMLSTTTIVLHPDLNTSVGLMELFRNLVAAGYVLGTAIVIWILWHLMIKDCPISPAAKWNYESSHDKSLKGVKVVTAIASAIASKGTANSIDNVATALDDYFDVEKESQNMEERASVNPKVRLRNG